MDTTQILQDNTQLKQVLLFLYGYQTPEEQSAEVTVEQNGVGFNMIDATILSSYAQQVIGGAELSAKQYTIARLRLGKYHAQLASGEWQRIEIPTVTRVNGSKDKYSQLQISFQGHDLDLQPGTYNVTVDSMTTTEDSVKVAMKVGMEVSNLVTGILDMDSNGGLKFTPKVYPSKQIKTAGFSTFTNGAWHQYHPKVFQTVVDDVRKLFGNILVTDAVLQALQPQSLIELPLDILEHPDLLEYQKQAIAITASSKRMLLALAPRLGKSVVSILSAKLLKKKRILIISPLTLLVDWSNKIARWTGGEKTSIVYRKNVLVPGAVWTVTNYDTLVRHPEIFQYENWDLIIVDESLLVKNRKTKRTEAVYQLMLHTKPEHVWLLSGNPKAKLYADLWAQFHILDPNRFSSYWKFADRYCIRQETQWSKYNLVGNQPDAADRIKQDQQDIYFSLLAEDVTDLPVLEPENMGVRMSTRQEKMYRAMEEEFMAETEDGEGLFASNVLSQLTRLLQIASNPLLVGGPDDGAKWNAIVEMLQYEPHPAIVWTSYIETARQLREKLMSKQWSVAVLTGATPATERGLIVDDFQAGRINVLIAHPAVGKYGLDLYNAKSVIYLERGFNSDDYYQSMNRVRHVNQKVAPHIVQLLAERAEGGETVDHAVDMVLKMSTEDTRKLTAGRLKSILFGGEGK